MHESLHKRRALLRQPRFVLTPPFSPQGLTLFPPNYRTVYPRSDAGSSIHGTSTLSNEIGLRLNQLLELGENGHGCESG